MNIDHLYQVERIVVDGEAPIEGYGSLPGGSAANTIYALAKLGVRSGFIGAVGDDEIGKTLIEDFQSVGVNTSHIKVKKGAKTGSVLCLSDKQGRRSLYVLPGANSLLTADDIDLNYVNQARILHLSSFVHHHQFELQREILTNLQPSVKVSFAPGALYAAKGFHHLSPLLKRTHFLFINHSELNQLTGEGFALGAKNCLEQGCEIIVVTFGGTPAAYILSRKGEYVVESKLEQESVVDTTGAGDAFAAGFLYGFLKGKDLKQCGLLGDIMARFCIAKIGAREGLPSLAELSQEYLQFYGQSL